MKGKDKEIKAIFDQSFPMPSLDQTDATCERVFERLNSAETPAPRPHSERSSRAWWQITPIRVAAALAGVAILSIVFVKTVLLPESVYAIVSKGPVYRMQEGKPQAVPVGEKIQVGTVVRTDEKESAVLDLPDGAQIEMQPMSELFLQQARDSITIKLNDGGARVTPAKQPARNLYLQNKEMIVPVLAAMFQTTGIPASQAASEPEPMFEEVSIRPSPTLPTGVGIRGGPPGGVPVAPGLTGCPMMPFELDPGRFAANSITLHGLVDLAYSGLCLSPEVFSGGPEWLRTDLYDIQAVIPAGTPAYTKQELREGRAPKVQKMLQNMLASRFKLILRRDMKEMPIYNLVAVKPEKLRPAGDQSEAAARMAEVRRAKPMFGVTKVSMAGFAGILTGQLGRPVFDKTNVKGDYEILIVLSDEPPTMPPPGAGADFRAESLKGMRDAIYSRLEEQTGLKLEPARAQVEVLIVERAERPSEN